MAKSYGGSHFLAFRSENFSPIAPINEWTFKKGFSPVWERHGFGPPVKSRENFIVGRVDLSVFCVLLLMTMLYGGIHLLLWNYGFPIRAESILWKISATILFAIPVVTVVLFILFATVGGAIVIPIIESYESQEREKKERELDANNRRGSLRMKKPNFFERYRFWIGLFCKSLAVAVLPFYYVACSALALGNLGGLISYAPARIFIIVESFISLRHVPVGVYENLSWAQYIPHL